MKLTKHNSKTLNTLSKDDTAFTIQILEQLNMLMVAEKILDAKIIEILSRYTECVKTPLESIESKLDHELEGIDDSKQDADLLNDQEEAYESNDNYQEEGSQGIFSWLESIFNTSIEENPETQPLSIYIF